MSERTNEADIAAVTHHSGIVRFQDRKSISS